MSSSHQLLLNSDYMLPVDNYNMLLYYLVFNSLCDANMIGI